MLGHTKSRRTRVKSILRTRVIERNGSWRESFKQRIQEHSEAGLVLRGCRYRAEITQKELAKAIGISQHHISEMENGKRNIGKEMAKRLAEFFKTDYRVFL